MPLCVGRPSCYPQPSAAFAADRLDRLRAVAQDREPECQAASAAMAFHPGEVGDYDRVYRYPARYDWYDALSNPFLSLLTVLVDYLTRARLLGSEGPLRPQPNLTLSSLAFSGTNLPKQVSLHLSG